MNGDRIRLDVRDRRLDLLVDPAELVRRREVWKPTCRIPGRGYVALFPQHVTPTDRGCGCDFDFLHAGEAIPEPEIH